MRQSRMFFVAPDTVHLRAHYDWSTGYWSVRASSTIRNEQGEYELVGERVYTALTIDEALDVLAADVQNRLKPGGSEGDRYE